MVPRLRAAGKGKLCSMILPSTSPALWLLGLVAAVAYAVPAAVPARWQGPAACPALALAWCSHAAVLAWAMLGAVPRFGFGPALSTTGWLVLTVYAIERQWFPQLQARWALALLGALAVWLALLFPGQPLPVTASAWLPLHLVLGIACYGLLAAAVVHAALMVRAERQMRRGLEAHSGMPLLTLERLTFRFVAAGFVLLTATLLAGVLFTEALYGRAWRWDHKAVFSVLSWVTLAALLLGRWRFGWRGRSAVRMLYAGTLLLLLAYAGSRFVLEVVLGRGA